MNSQHKLYNFEVSPPAEAWQRIAQELDGVNQYREVSKKLQQLQVEPPAMAWSKINSELNDQLSFDIIKKKMTALTVLPPAGVWDKIASAMTESASVVTKKDPAPVVPLRTRIFRYASVAAILGAIVMAAFFLARQNSHDAAEIQAKLETIQPVKPTTVTPASKPQPAAEKKTSAAMTSRENLKDSVQIAPVPVSAEGIVTTSNGNAYTTSVEKSKEMNGRYIVLMTEEGNVVRMNKKISSMADCIAGDDHSSECNNQIAAWQKEVANMPGLASPDNFLSLLELASRESAGAGM